jgi:hypothetical protein
MRAPSDHRDGGTQGPFNGPGSAVPAAGASIVRSRLFIKYVILFVTVVGLALVANGAFDIYFSYQEQKTSLVRIQREQAEAAAAKSDSSSARSKDRSAGPRNCPGRPERWSNVASTRCGSYGRCRPSPNSPRSTLRVTNS